MSVKCQNFIQNAWKKDLCSNCFKSVGDHENFETECNEIESKTNGKSIPESETNGNSMVHTTWKSLITNKNDKNKQPFKLENGFHGRLLKINTAVNVFENKMKHNAKVNIYSSRNKVNADLPNGQHETAKSSAEFKVQPAKQTEPSSNCVANSNNRSLDNKKTTGKKLAVEAPVIQNLKTPLQLHENLDINNQPITNKKLNSKIEKLKAEFSKETRCPASNGSSPKVKSAFKINTIHSILKKSTSDNATTQNNRRNSSVGFKDEDPIVIGYGGRDFFKEELEWEVASSDGEGSHMSMDETEDDKEFSKLTKVNTDFNADNLNWPITDKPKKDDVSALSSKEKESGQKNETFKIKKAAPAIPHEEIKIEKIKESSGDQTQYNIHETVQKGKSIFEKTACDDKIKEPIVNSEIAEPFKLHCGIDAEKKLKSGENNINNERRSIPKCAMKASPVESKISRKAAKTYGNGNNNNDKPEQQTNSLENILCDTISVTTTFTTHVTCDENNITVPNGASIASEYGLTVVNNSTNDCPLPAQETFCSLGTTVNSQSRAKSFGEEFLDPPNVDLDSEEVVHEAFNTTLVALQNMDGSEDSEMHHKVCTTNEDDLTNSLECNIVVNSDVLNKNDKKEIIKDSRIQDLTSYSKTDDGVFNEKKNVDMEPRVSFLHGTKSDYKDESLNAIYAPGADFFVSRRNSTSSCSSSSSDDQKTITIELTNSPDDNKNISETEKNENLCEAQPFVECEKIMISNGVDRTTTTISSTTLNINEKPTVPLKPRKPPIINAVITTESGHYAKPSIITKIRNTEKVDEINDIYHLATQNYLKEKSMENHYAESSIYHEINDKVLAIIESGEGAKDCDARESKLAALAMELEQARHSNAINSCSKRHAPSPPKIPEAPLEEPPSSLDRFEIMSASLNPPNGFRDTVAFSSASSTTSSSSQDDVGIGTWSLQSDGEENGKSSKWKNSFLLAQYSKCKMLAMGCGDDKLRPKKKFSLKKLLKLGKDADFAVHSGSISSNRKAWKYSDNFDRPRPKLDIIHPMDLENKSLTINPGFDSSKSTTTSFTSGVEVISIRNSTSSDYGTYYSDTAAPEGESNYEYVIPERCHSTADQIFKVGATVSPTPSRCSAYSQASTLTSGSSRNGSIPTGRPPKPPPPPRAHSLLPNRTVHKQISSDEQSSSGSSVFAEENEATSLPQAPRRPYRKSDYDNKSCCSLDFAEAEAQPFGSVPVSLNGGGDYEFVGGREFQSERVVTANICESARQEGEEDSGGDGCNSSLKGSAPVSKAPSKPPPMYYCKLSSSSAVRENAWKTLEGSYTALASNNREILLKLLDQTIKRQQLVSVKNQGKLQWQDFKLNNANPARFFAGGDQVVYDAVISAEGNQPVTLLISLKTSQTSHFNSQLKYPVFGHFYGNIPSHLLLEETRTDLEMESIQVSVNVLYRCDMSSLDNYIQDIPDELDATLEKELAFILLQVIQELKGFQVQGIEELDASFKTLLVAKTKEDTFHTLLFLQQDFFEESAYSLVMDDCKLSLCQFALSLVFQIFKVESIEELSAIGGLKFSQPTTMKIFESVAVLLSEEKAVSLSQSKSLLECFLWNVQSLVHRKEFVASEADVVLQRWIDIERSHFIKTLINSASMHINTQTELHSQFLIRSTVKNIKDIMTYL